MGRPVSSLYILTNSSLRDESDRVQSCTTSQVSRAGNRGLTSRSFDAFLLEPWSTITTPSFSAVEPEARLGARPDPSNVTSGAAVSTSMRHDETIA